MSDSEVDTFVTKNNIEFTSVRIFFVFCAAARRKSFVIQDKGILTCTYYAFYLHNGQGLAVATAK